MMASILEEWVEDRFGWVEDRFCAICILHVMPSRLGRGRPKLEEEASQDALWARVAPGLAWELPPTSAETAEGCVEQAVSDAASIQCLLQEQQQRQQEQQHAQRQQPQQQRAVDGYGGFSWLRADDGCAVAQCVAMPLLLLQ